MKLFRSGEMEVTILGDNKTEGNQLFLARAMPSEMNLQASWDSDRSSFLARLSRAFLADGAIRTVSKSVFFSFMGNILGFT
ncbi:MAG: hypothetical protein WCO26_12050 [Deltaproteobacteria bacterium]